MGRHVFPLKDQWAGDSEFRVIHADNLETLMPLFSKAYHQVYLPHFPLDADWDDLSIFLKIMRNPDSARDMVIVVAGNGLYRDIEKSTVKGICIGMYLKGSDTAHLDYIAVDRKFRTEGLGFALYNIFSKAVADRASLHGGVLEGLFINCQNPVKPIGAGRDACDYSAAKRVKKYQMWGARIVPIEYKIGYVTLRNGFRIDTGDVLLSFANSATNTHPDAKVIGDHVRRLWECYSPGHDVSAVPAYQDVMRTVKSLRSRGQLAKSPSSQISEFIRGLGAICF